MFKTFIEAEKYLQDRDRLGIKPGLERVQGLLNAAGNPERSLKAVHIAGTNGKGSTAHYLMNGLIKSGHRTGFFTSPSFSGLTGHIFVNGQPISETDFLRHLNAMLPAIHNLDEKAMEPTAFEIITVLALMHLHEVADIAVIETGMGGRFDTTNCFEPLLSIITNIAKDHAAFLGHTDAEIAYHKAGIIKAGCPGIVGKVSADALEVIEQEAKQVKAPLYQLGRDFWVERLSEAEGRQQFTWKSAGLGECKAVLSMHGLHQADNAALALMALSLLEQEDIAVDWESALQGIGETNVFGRFEVVSLQPKIVLDGAHNPDGIRAFTETAGVYAKDRNKQLIFSAFKDKEADVMLEILKQDFISITLVTFDHPRAMDEEELYALASRYELQAEPDWQLAIERAMQAEKNEVTFVTGSLNFILQVREFIKKRRMLDF